MALPRGHILLIGEQPQDYEVLSQVLATRGYMIGHLNSADEGLREAELREPDLIFLDMGLNHGKGLDVCRNLRLRNSTWSIPIILIADTETPEAEIVRGLDMGANDCVSRPFRSTELLGRVGVLMRMKRVEDKLRRLYVERTKELEWSNMELQKIRTQLILKSQMSTLGMLVAVAAHEIRSPANSISGNLEQFPDLFRQFITTLLEVLDQLPAGAQERQLYIEALLETLEQNLGATPMDVPSRRRQVREISERLPQAVLDQLEEDDIEQLARFQFAERLELMVNFVVEQSSRSLHPFFHLSELLVKLKNMQISIERINRIVRAMKAWSHIDRAELQELDIHAGLEDTLTIMNYIFRGNVEVSREFCDELPRAMGYPGELNQVWTNLLQNAYDALEGHDRRIVVGTGIETYRNRTYVKVTVRDNGKGIAPEILPHIFDSFFTTKEKGSGSGLGLDICKQIIDKHQGEIRVESRPGDTCFTVLLPVEQRKETQLGHQARSIDFSETTPHRLES